MPQLVDPLLAQHALPEELYSSYSRSAVEIAKAIKSFAKFMQEPGPQETLRRAKESSVANPEEIAPWIVTEHPDWLEVRNKGAEGVMAKQEGGLQDGQAAVFPTAGEVLPAVERFRAKHPSVEINQRKSEPATIEVDESVSNRS